MIRNHYYASDRIVPTVRQFIEERGAGAVFDRWELIDYVSHSLKTRRVLHDSINRALRTLRSEWDIVYIPRLFHTNDSTMDGLYQIMEKKLLPKQFELGLFDEIKMGLDSTSQLDIQPRNKY